MEICRAYDMSFLSLDDPVGREYGYQKFNSLPATMHNAALDVEGVIALFQNCRCFVHRLPLSPIISASRRFFRLSD